MFISVYYNIINNELNILTDGQRMMTPIFDHKPSDKEDIKKLIEEGHMIFICPTMIQNFVISEFNSYGSDKRIKWCFPPSACLGLLPAMNPLQNHNKGVRSVYMGAQMKSAQSQTVSNYTNYYIKNLLVNNDNLHDMIYTPFNEIQFSNCPTTQLVHLIIMPFKDNQQDAVIMCQDFIERFGFATTQFKTFIDQCQGTGEMFQMPTFVKHNYNYSKIDTNLGEISQLGTVIDYNDVLIAKSKSVSVVGTNNQTNN